MLLNALILVTLLCWSVWGLFDKKAIETANTKDVLLMQHLLYAAEVPVIGFILVYLHHGVHIDPMVFFWQALSSLGSSAAIPAYLIAMRNAEASYVLSITASYPVVTQVLAQYFLGEPIIGKRVTGSFLIGAGVAAIGFSPSSKKQVRHWKRKLTVALCITFATLMWGIYGLFDKKAVQLSSSLEVYFARTCCDAVVLLLIIIYFKSTGYKPDLSSKKSWLFCMLSGICMTFGTLSFMQCLSMATASYVIVITGCYPLLMYLFALIFLKEKLNVLRVVGVLLLVLGGIMVQATQS